MNVKNAVCGVMLALLASVIALPMVKRQTDGRDIIPGSQKPSPAPTPNPKSAADTIEFVRIPAGEFMMGSDNRDVNGQIPALYELLHESPVHLVRISRSFELGKYEVTQSQWEAVMGNNPSHFKGANLPVENVSWEDVEQFIQKMNKRNDGYTYRLPTESEWEYAARAGSKGKYSFGDDETRLSEYAWYGETLVGKTHPVGQKKPNDWGLYDMYGNVWEWVQDWMDWYSAYPTGPVTDPSGPPGPIYYKMQRGGSWGAPAQYCRSASRHAVRPENRGNVIGFRLARTTK